MMDSCLQRRLVVGQEVAFQYAGIRSRGVILNIQDWRVPALVTVDPGTDYPARSITLPEWAFAPVRTPHRMVPPAGAITKVTA